MLASLIGQGFVWLAVVHAWLRKALVKDLNWTVKRPPTLAPGWLSGAQAASMYMVHSVVVSTRPRPVALSRYREPPFTAVGASAPDARVK